MDKNFTKITPEIKALAKKCSVTDHIEAKLYEEYDVKRGLRDLYVKGVLKGLT